MAVSEFHIMRTIKSRPSMKYYFTCFLILFSDQSSWMSQKRGFAVAFTTTPNKVCNSRNSNCVFHKSHGGTLFVSNPVDEYVETISHNNNNHHNNNNNNNNSDGADATATFIEIPVDLPFETSSSSSSSTTSSFATLNPTTTTTKKKTDKIKYEFFTGDARKRQSLKKKRKKTESVLPTPVSKLYRNANKALRRDTSSSARLSRAQETDLAYAIQDLKTAIRVRDELNDPLEEQWAAACNLTVRQLRRVMIWGREARSQLVAANVGLVRSIAKKYSGDLKRATQYSGGIGTILTLQDMIQEGNLGLMEAAERFEPSRGFRFSTYASYWVRQRILRSIADHSRVIRLPAHGTYTS